MMLYMHVKLITNRWAWGWVPQERLTCLSQSLQEVTMATCHSSPPNTRHTENQWNWYLPDSTYPCIELYSIWRGQKHTQKEPLSKAVWPAKVSIGVTPTTRDREGGAKVLDPQWSALTGLIRDDQQDKGHVSDDKRIRSPCTCKNAPHTAATQETAGQHCLDFNLA